jgi:WD40 repeat protein
MLLLTTACGGEAVQELLDRCLMNKNSDYAQSEAIKCVYRLESGTQEFQASDSTPDVQFGPDSSTLYTMSTLIQTWDMSTGEETNVCELEDCHTRFEVGNQMFFSQADGYVGFNQVSRIYTGFTTNDAPLFLSDVPPYTNEAYIEGQDVFASYNDSLIYFYDRTTGELVSEQSLEQGIVEVVGARRSYATSIADMRIVIWPIADDMKGLVLEGHKADVVKMIYSDDESLFLAADRSGLLIVWELVNGTEVQRIQLNLEEAASEEMLPTIELALSPDNALLAARADGRIIRFWSLASEEVIAEMSIAKFGVMDLDIAPDGSKLAVGLSWAGKYDQNARPINRERPLDPQLLEPGEALVFDISGLRP